MNCLVDTNVLVYALDGRDRKRQTRAGDWLAYLVRDGRGAVSAQALTEDMAGGATLDGVTIVDPFELAPPT
jgi:predicted nucleic acid-binding protein